MQLYKIKCNQTVAAQIGCGPYGTCHQRHKIGNEWEVICVCEKDWYGEYCDRFQAAVKHLAPSFNISELTILTFVIIIFITLIAIVVIILFKFKQHTTQTGSAGSNGTVNKNINVLDPFLQISHL